MTANEPRKLRLMSDGPSEEALEGLKKMKEEIAVFQREMPVIRKEGEAALRRLLPIAQGGGGQCRYVAAFLLGLYHGGRFPFDLTDLRGLDRHIFNDCIAVLRMDRAPLREVHKYFEGGNEIWEDLAIRWGRKDHLADTRSM